MTRNDWAEYESIQGHYKSRTALRSGALLMDHIDQGLDILKIMGADIITRKAYCLHPLFQADHALSNNIGKYDLEAYSSTAIVLAMEYRAVANAHLSRHDPKIPTLSFLPQVNQMLVADKLQNRAAFYRASGCYRYPNEIRLNEYFKEWITALSEAFPNIESLWEDKANVAYRDNWEWA